MWRTFVFSINLLFFVNCSLTRVQGQDTIPIPLKIKIGVEAVGPAMYYSDKNILNTEAYISVDLNERRSFMIAAGYLDFKYKQYNYEYRNKGVFVRTGIDFNLLKPDKSLGKYYAGIGLRYGMSRFNSEIPYFEKENYWGITTSSVSRKTNWGHFLEVSPGVRAEIFKNFSLGWSISLRMLLYSGTGKDLRPVYFPGFGNGTKKISSGISYFIVWNIPYKKINAIMKKDVSEESEEGDETGTTGSGEVVR